MPTALTPAAQVRIAGRLFPFTNYEQVSAAYSATIDAAGVGSSETPRCDILDPLGNVVAYVSYNGRVWQIGRDGFTNIEALLYDPVGGFGDWRDAALAA